MEVDEEVNRCTSEVGNLQAYISALDRGLRVAAEKGAMRTGKRVDSEKAEILDHWLEVGIPNTAYRCHG
jgi:hypothetical protein